MIQINSDNEKILKMSDNTIGKKRLNRNCPICDIEHGTTLGTLKYTLFDDDTLANTFNVVCCDKCGLVFYDTPSLQDDYDRFYEKSFYSSTYLDCVSNTDEKRYATQALDNLIPYIKDKNVSIFDIGCSIGTLLKTLHALGYENLYGVDPSLSCVDILNKHKGVQAKIGSISNIPFDNIKADVIILSHIIEHIIDLPFALQNIRNKLSEDGIVYVEVPDASRYDTFDNVSPLSYFYFQHVTHFDQYHLNNLFANNGYRMVNSGDRLRIEGEQLIHCTWGIFRKDNVMSSVVKPHFHLSHQIKTWLDNASLDNDNIIADIAHYNTLVYVWGIGTTTHMMLAMSPLRNCNIKYFIDKDERNQRRTIGGKNIYPIDMLYDATDRDTVIICAPTHSQKMFDYLTKQVGFKGKIIVCGFGNVCLK